MTEIWVTEFLKGIARVFLNPLLYWSVIFIVLIGLKRIKEERKQFGQKIFDVFSEVRKTWTVSIVSGVIISAILIGAGFVFSYVSLILLSIVIIILGLTRRAAWLSPSYTAGFSFVILLVLPIILEKQSFISLPDSADFPGTNVTGLVLLLGMLLLVEARLLKRIKSSETFPALTEGNRGKWIGQHHLKKVAIIPLVLLIPSGLITPILPYWPSFAIGEHSFSFLFIPFLLGFDHIVKGELPIKAAKRLAKSIDRLGVIVILAAIASIYISWISLLSVIIAVIGRELIRYRFHTNDNERTPYFHLTADGLKVLAIIPGTPAARFNILSGETIRKVNGRKVTGEDEFYYALQISGAHVKLEVIDETGENRIIQGPLYQNEHHELGILFARKRYAAHYRNVDL